MTVSTTPSTPPSSGNHAPPLHTIQVPSPPSFWQTALQQQQQPTGEDVVDTDNTAATEQQPSQQIEQRQSSSSPDPPGTKMHLPKPNHNSQNGKPDPQAPTGASLRRAAVKASKLQQQTTSTEKKALSVQTKVSAPTDRQSKIPTPSASSVRSSRSRSSKIPTPAPHRTSSSRVATSRVTSTQQNQQQQQALDDDDDKKSTTPTTAQPTSTTSYHPDDEDDTSTMASSVQELRTTPHPSTGPRISVIGSPQDFLKQRKTVGGSVGRLKSGRRTSTRKALHRNDTLEDDDDRSYASTQKAYSVSGVSVFDRLYHEAKVRSNRKAKKIAQANAQQEFNLHRSIDYRTTPGGGRRSGIQTPSSSLRRGANSSSRKKQPTHRATTADMRHPQQHDDDADSAVSSLQSPSAAASYYSQQHSPQRRRYQYTYHDHHDADLHSVTSQERRRFFDGSHSVTSHHTTPAAFERLYQNQYETSASRHLHNTPNHLSPVASLHRRVNYRPSPQQCKNAHFLRPATWNSHVLECTSPLNADDNFIQELSQRAGNWEVHAATTIQRHWRRVHFLPQWTTSHLNVPTFELTSQQPSSSAAGENHDNALQPRLRPTVETDSAASDPTKKSSPPNRTTPSAAGELAKWKQLRREWFLDHISDDSDEQRDAADDDKDDASLSSEPETRKKRASSPPPKEEVASDDLSPLFAVTDEDEGLVKLKQRRLRQQQKQEELKLQQRQKQEEDDQFISQQSSASSSQNGGALSSESSSLQARKENQQHTVVDSTRELQWQELQQGWTSMSLASSNTPSRFLNTPAASRKSKFLQPSLPTIESSPGGLSGADLDNINNLRSPSPLLPATPQTEEDKEETAILQAFESMRKRRQSFLAFRRSVQQMQIVWRQRLHSSELYRDSEFTALNHVVEEGHCRAASAIQAWYRTKRREYKTQREAAAPIEMGVEELLERAKWTKRQAMMPFVAPRIQAQWRMIKARNIYVGRQQACIILQSAWRSFAARQYFWQRVASAAILQACWRRLMALHRYRELRTAGILIQSVWRRKMAHQAYLHQWATDLQAYCRRALAMWKLKRERTAATRIQAIWRCSHTARMYNEQQRAAMRLQSWSRRQLSVQRFQRQLLAMQVQTMAAVRIQSCYRCFSARLNYMHAVVACIVLQSHCRGVSSRRSYHQKRGAILELQTKWRSFSCASAFSQKRTASLSIQAALRRFLDQQTFQTLKRSALTIQNSWRSHQCYRDFTAKILAVRTMQYASDCSHAATLIGLWWRSRLLAREQVQTKAVIKIQSQARAGMALQHYSRSLTGIKLLQSVTRGYLVRTSLHTQTRENAALMIQSQWRATLCRVVFAMTRKAAIVLQSSCRAHHQRRSFSIARAASTTVAKAWKAAVVRGQWRRTRACTIMIQSCARTWIATAKLGRQKSAAVQFQAQVRGHIARDMYQSIQQQEVAACCLQAQWRSAQARHEYSSYRDCVVLIQAKTRASIATAKVTKLLAGLEASRNAIADEALEQAATVRVQAKESMVEQGVTPESQSQECAQEELADCTNARPAITIQKVARGLLQRRELRRQRDAAHRICRFYILWKTKLLLLKFQCGTVLLRRGIQGGLPKCTSFALSQVNACLKSDFPIALAQKGLSSDVALHVGYIWGVASSQAKECASVVVQRYLRGFTCRHRFHQQVNAALILQRCVRKFLSKSQIEVNEESALEGHVNVERQVEVRFANDVEVSTVKRHEEEDLPATESIPQLTQPVVPVEQDTSEAEADRQYEKGVESLVDFFDNEVQERQHREDVTNWFLDRLEMRSESTAQLLLLNPSSNSTDRACLDHLAERARLARAQIDADAKENFDGKGDGIGNGPSCFGMETSDYLEVTPVFGIEGILSPIAKQLSHKSNTSRRRDVPS